MELKEDGNGLQVSSHMLHYSFCSRSIHELEISISLFLKCSRLCIYDFIHLVQWLGHCGRWVVYKKRTVKRCKGVSNHWNGIRTGLDWNGMIRNSEIMG